MVMRIQCPFCRNVAAVHERFGGRKLRCRAVNAYCNFPIPYNARFIVEDNKMPAQERQNLLPQELTCSKLQQNLPPMFKPAPLHLLLAADVEKRSMEQTIMKKLGILHPWLTSLFCY